MRTSFGFKAAIAIAALGATVCNGAVQVQSYLSGLSRPIFVTSAEDGTRRLFVVEQTGEIKVVQPDATSTTTFLNIASKITTSGSEQGLLGLAFHPDYPLNGRFFVNYTRSGDGATVVAEYHVSTTNVNVAAINERILLTIAQPFANHNGGMIDFGLDGYLYVGMGDGGDANDPGNRAQNINELLGKMLRIDVDHTNGTTNYASPPDNPFYGATAGRDEIYAYGLRNPWRWSFDRGGTRQLYLGDVGQGTWEEIDIIVRGGNYGWRIMEGAHCNPDINSNCTPPANHIPPIAEYGHTNSRCSVTGGYIYRGVRGTVPAGVYIFGEYCTGEIFQLSPANSSGQVTRLLDTSLNISSFGEDEAGELYVANLNGTVGRFVTSPAPTGCSYQISPTNQSVTATGAVGSLSVTAGNDCAWMARSHADWITLTTTNAGQGNGTLGFVVAANTSASARVGNIMVAGRAFVITQELAIALSIERRTDTVTIRWPTNGSGYAVEATPTLPPINWTTVSVTPVVQGTNYAVTDQVSGDSRFYRLRKP